MTKYDYGSAFHKQWRAALKKAWGLRGCFICNRHAANPKTGKRRKGVRLHSHHVYGTGHVHGVILCASCHEVITLLSSHVRGVFEDPEMFEKLLDLVRKRIAGTPITKEKK